jgi:NhaP-type Na+/H+ or K+/H+ antiporter
MGVKTFCKGLLSVVQQLFKTSFSGMVFRLAFIPCLTEAATVAVASHFLLDLPWLWGFMLGFVLAAVSPGFFQMLYWPQAL